MDDVTGDPHVVGGALQLSGDLPHRVAVVTFCGVDGAVVSAGVGGPTGVFMSVWICAAVRALS